MRKNNGNDPQSCRPPLCPRIQEFLDGYAELGAVRFVERLHTAYREMLANITRFEEIAPARRRTVAGKKITVREYVLNAGARDFLVLYWEPPDPVEPILLLNIRIGGQNRFRWTENRPAGE